MGADQHPFEEAMRIAFEIPAILERSGLAFVAIDRHQPRAGLAEHRAPLSPRGKARAAETAQGCIIQRLQEIVPGQFTGAQTIEQHIAAAGNIGVIVDVVGQMRVGIAILHRRKHACRSGMVDEVMADLDCRRRVAAADTRRTHHANAGADPALKLVQQLFRTHHGAGERIANANGQRRDVRLRPPSPHRNARRRSRSRTLRQTPASSRRQGPRGERRKSDDTCPGSGADARSGDRGGAAGRRAEARSPVQPPDRSGGPWASIWLACVPPPDGRTSELFARRGSLKRLVYHPQTPARRSGKRHVTQTTHSANTQMTHASGCKAVAPPHTLN